MINKIENKYYWEIQAFKQATEKGLEDCSVVVVIAYSEEEALKKAKSIFKKENYRVSRVTEIDNPMQLSEEMHMAQIEIQKRFLDSLEGHKHD